MKLKPRVVITKESAQSRTHFFEDIPVGVFYGNFVQDAATPLLYMKGSSHTVQFADIDTLLTFTNSNNGSMTVYNYRPVIAEIVIKEIE